MTNERKLMPYEHQLIEALDITKEDYLDFVAQQHAYEDIKEGTIFDARNDVAAPISLVLTIVGTLLQVVAALLAQPEEDGRKRTRDDIFAPRTGFNSTQQLAAYGDPVNLVYANLRKDGTGGVRVNTALLWSAMKSFGSSQYIQMLLLIGAGGIGRIDYERSAFGQTPVRDLVSQNYWLYFKENGTGALAKRNLFEDKTNARDPGAIGNAADSPYQVFARNQFSAVTDGFSNAISPSTSNAFGVYAPVPLNTKIEVRNKSGSFRRAAGGIYASSLANWGENARFRANGIISKGEQLLITIKKTEKDYDSIQEEEAAEFRRAVSQIFDNAGVMKLGSAHFSVLNINTGSTEDKDMRIDLICTQAGRAPSIIYNADDPIEDAQAIANNNPVYLSLQKTVEALLNEDERAFIFFSDNTSDIPGTSSLPTFSPEQQLLNDGRILVVSERFLSEVAAFAEAGDLAPAPITGSFSSSYFLDFKRNLTEEEKQLLQTYINYQQEIAKGTSGDDLFFTKALVKIETAKYETLSPCHMVDFALKAQVWRRISGRQEKYGSKRLEGYDSSDNGIKKRSSMFLVKYKKTKDKNFRFVKGIFVVSRAADVDNFIYFRFDSGLERLEDRYHWQFEIEPIHDCIAEFSTRDLTDTQGRFRFFYLENSGDPRRISAAGAEDDKSSIIFTGSVRISNNKLPPLNNTVPKTNEWDLFSHTSDTQLQMSFDGGPEFTVTAVTEQIRENFNNYKDRNGEQQLYKDLALLGFNMYSGRSVQDLRSFTVFVEKGRRSRLLRTSGEVDGIKWGSPLFEYLPGYKNGDSQRNPKIGSDALIKGTSYYITDIGNTNWQEAGLPTNTTAAVGEVFIAKGPVSGTGKVRAGGFPNTAPDIFVDTLLDANDGIGKYAGDLFSIDLEQLARSKKFCEKNQLFMDGVIAEPTSWRQFWSETAGFSLLELTKQDGKESLVPAVPYNKRTGSIERSLQISALFNPGNILEDSYKEEFIDYGAGAEDVVVTVVYRDNESEGAFPRNNSVDVMLRDTQEENAFRETIDTSTFVTNRNQAILLGKYLCQVRRHSRRSIEFKTFPTDSFVAPGSYIYVEFAQNQWNRIQTGIIGEGGKLNLPFGETIKDGSYQMLIYNPVMIENKTVYKEAEPIVDGASAVLRKFKDHVFVLGQVRRNKRVFRATEVSMDEEGEVTIKGVEHGTDADGLSLISEGLGEFVPGLFLIDGNLEKPPEQQ